MIETRLWKLNKYYPSEGYRIMPTSLGNVIRAAEDEAGNTYGLDTVITWPILYEVLPDKIKKQ
jgi:hypothetical protein